MRTKLLVLSTLASTSAFAHPGHDHAHWLSDPIHALTVIAIVGGAAVGIFLTVKNKMYKSNEKDN